MHDAYTSRKQLNSLLTVIPLSHKTGCLPRQAEWTRPRPLCSTKCVTIENLTPQVLHQLVFVFQALPLVLNIFHNNAAKIACFRLHVEIRRMDTNLTGPLEVNIV